MGGRRNVTGEDSDRPIAEGQEVYKTLIWTTTQTSPKITNPIRPRLLSCCRPPSQRTSQTQIRRPIRRFRILPSRLLLWKKDRNSRSTSSEPCWIRRHRYQFPQSNRRVLTRPIHTYPTHRHPLRNDWKFWSHISCQISYQLRTLSQVPVKRQYSRTLTNNDPLMFSLCWRQFQSIPNLLFSWRPLHPHANA